MKKFEELTIKFWIISLCWNNKGWAQEELTTEQALNALNEIMENTNPARPLNERAGILQDEIITGRKGSAHG